MKHTCHAIGCQAEVQPALLMCHRHWRMVPLRIRRLVWETYRKGQCDDKKPSTTWLQAAKSAIQYVRDKENRNEE